MSDELLDRVSKAIRDATSPLLSDVVPTIAVFATVVRPDGKSKTAMVVLGSHDHADDPAEKMVHLIGQVRHIVTDLPRATRSQVDFIEEESKH